MLKNLIVIFRCDVVFFSRNRCAGWSGKYWAEAKRSGTVGTTLISNGEPYPGRSKSSLIGGRERRFQRAEIQIKRRSMTYTRPTFTTPNSLFISHLKRNPRFIPQQRYTHTSKRKKRIPPSKKETKLSFFQDPKGRATGSQSKETSFYFLFTLCGWLVLLLAQLCCASSSSHCQSR